MVPPADPTPAYQPLPQGLDVEAVCCLAYARTVAADNTISFGGRHLQLLPNAGRASYARCIVEVRDVPPGWRSQRHLPGRDPGHGARPSHRTGLASAPGTTGSARPVHPPQTRPGYRKAQPHPSLENTPTDIIIEQLD